jgi:hypothetical protein
MTGDIEFYDDLYLGSPIESDSGQKTKFAGLYSNKNNPHKYCGIAFVNEQTGNIRPQVNISAGNGTNRNFFTVYGDANGGVEYNNVSFTDGTFLTTRTVSTPTITSSTSNGIYITAPAVSGYKFVCWYASSSAGDVYATYFGQPSQETSKVWWVGTAITGTHIECWALYVRKW